ncbi:MAG: response regulator [Solirubrobacteraceae bacterium]|nr:response regulator [Patulibacter sp.]
MTTSGHSILICDDDVAIRSLVKAILSADGHDLRQTATAPDAIAAIDEDPPALVLLDINVPGGDGGLSVLHHIRSQSTLSEVGVLMITGISEARADDWGRSIGADGHLLKPFQISDLRDAVSGLLSRV